MNGLTTSSGGMGEIENGRWKMLIPYLCRSSGLNGTENGGREGLTEDRVRSTRTKQGAQTGVNGGEKLNAMGCTHESSEWLTPNQARSHFFPPPLDHLPRSLSAGKPHRDVHGHEVVRVQRFGPEARGSSPKRSEEMT